MEKSINFTEGKIFKPLIGFTMPILAAIFLQGMYGAIDLLVVGQFGDASSVSAVATGSQIMQTITGIVTGLSMGITIMVGQKIGEKKIDEVEKIIGTCICLFGTIAFMLTVIMLASGRFLVKLMNTPTEAFEKTISYVLICSLGIVFIVAYNVISAIFRGSGNSKSPLLFVGIACVTNVLGDLVLIGVFRLDAIGAAVATVFAQAVSVFISLIIIKKRGLLFGLSRKSICFHKIEIKKILQFGAPIALQDALTNISFLIITAIINTLGLIASASIGVSEKIVVFIMLIPMSFMDSVSVFVAQNIGACQLERAKKTMYIAMVTSLSFGAIMFGISFWHGDILAGIFSSDSNVIAACAEYMKAYAIDCILVCILFCFIGYFNGSGKTIFVMVQGILAAFVFRIPISYFISKIPGVTMLQIGFASPIATAFSIIFCIIYYKRSLKI